MRTLLALSLLLGSTACRYHDVDVLWDLDYDGDGTVYADDCDDEDPDVHPGASERCNGEDDDCDGTIDEDAIDPETFWIDADGDGYGDPNGATTQGCTPPEGYAANDTDCDDHDSERSPGAAEVVDDGIDQDCNGFDTVTCYVDDDEDGYGTDLGTIALATDGSCDTEDGESTVATDCDDDNPDIHPGAVEIVNDSIDQNCDGSDLLPCFTDADGDGFGDPLLPIFEEDCDSDDRTRDNTDCDDGEGTIYPGAPELCDGQLNDCNGVMLAGEVDGDLDGFVGCTLDAGGWDGAGTVTGGDDCDDDEDTVHPGAPELCDGQLNDCDGAMLEGEVDEDGDGFAVCTLDAGGWDGTGAVIGGGDCNDDDATVYPGATELCDGQRNDCDLPGLPADESDDDPNGGDGYVECTITGTWKGDPVTGGDDCDDTDETVYPGATELCDGQLNDCDGTMLTAELDADGDDFIGCTVDAGGWDGGGATPLPGECDDHNAAIHPGATELCDGVDNDCDESLDDAGTVSFEDTAGHWFDVTSIVSPGTPAPELDFSIAGTLWFCQGTYDPVFTITTSDATLVGRYGDAFTTLTGSAANRPITVASTSGTLDLQGLTITAGSATNGGALFSDDDVDITVSHCTLSSSTATYGGAVYIAAGSLTIDQSTVSGNTATSTVGLGGGIYQYAGTVTITGSVLEDNDALGGGGDGGGAVAVRDGTLNITNSVVTNNDAVNNDGGGVLVDGATGLGAAVVNITGSTISNNSAYDWGGAIACHRACTITATDSFIVGNTSDEGAGILLAPAPGTGTFTCTGIIGAAYGVYDNTATNTSTHVGGGIDLYENGASVTSTHCNWGSGETDNSPSDVAGGTYHRSDFGADATFTCNFTGCL